MAQSDCRTREINAKTKEIQGYLIGGFAFEVQLSLTEKGQYAVAYDLSCKKDCHELHATDPRRTIPHPIPV
ncbi:hypothetical protein ACNPJA_09805, partial [Neisseria meningitidis]